MPLLEPTPPIIGIEMGVKGYEGNFKPYILKAYMNEEEKDL
jgi:hypothetical protein